MQSCSAAHNSPQGYTFRVFVTNRAGDAVERWCDYNLRACVAQHIEELKNDLQTDGFCMQDLFATECAFLSVCFTASAIRNVLKAGADKEGVQVSLQIHSHEEEAEMMARGEGH